MVRLTSTYRLQLHTGFPFAAALEIVPYLRDLGISHLYLSPISQAEPGSTHGYDVTDCTAISVELGGRSGFDELAGAVHAAGMGILLDIVPNHMAASHHNAWWVDVLEKGRVSAYAGFFDVFWPAEGGPLELPVLARPFGESLEAGDIRLETDDDGPHIAAGSMRLPLSPASRQALGDDVTGAIASYNGSPGSSAGWEAMEALLSRQEYVLSAWSIARERVSYRRFFDIGGLVGMNVEQPEVFEATHGLVLDLVARGQVDGLRVDHIDGLRDPRAYLAMLTSRLPAGFPVFLEKILGAGEELPPEWPVAGTTGYEFIRDAERMLLHPEGVRRLGFAYSTFTGSEAGEGEVIHEAKRFVVAHLFAGERRRLLQEASDLATKDRHARDLSPAALADALDGVTASLDVYRTYIDAEVSRADRRRIDGAIASYRGRDGAIDERACAFLQRTLAADSGNEAAQAFAQRWQQFTAPVTAKGVEDTAFYRFNRLLSMNEIGGDLSLPSSDAAEAFHQARRATLEQHPLCMNATSTHDTKRSEDVRARLHILSELALEFAASVSLWQRRNGRHKRHVLGREAPDADEEWAIYQTLIGVWPLDDTERALLPGRLDVYLTKALREAKRNSSWAKPDLAYERAVSAFMRAILKDTGPRGFMESFERLASLVSYCGFVGSLSLVLLKLLAPGTPDFYQGCELLDFSLTDPDNRRPVDYGQRHTYLEELARQSASGPSELMRTWRDSRAKLHLTSAGLRFRRDHPDLVTYGAYVPLEVVGDSGSHVIAFARALGDEWALALAPRHVAAFAREGQPPLGPNVWGDTRVVLPDTAPAAWLSTLDSHAITRTANGFSVGKVLSEFPVALLYGRASS